MDKSRYALAIPALAGLGLALGAACTQRGDVLSGPLEGLVGSWNLHTVVAQNAKGQGLSYSYPSVRQYSDCSNTLSVRLAVEEQGTARMWLNEHYECQGEAQNDNAWFYDFEVETFGAGRRWYLYYIFDHAPEMTIDPPPGADGGPGSDAGSDAGSGDDGDDDGDESGGGPVESPPIPERLLQYTCTLQAESLRCDEFGSEPPVQQTLYFSNDDANF